MCNINALADDGFDFYLNGTKIGTFDFHLNAYNGIRFITNDTIPSLTNSNTETGTYFDTCANEFFEGSGYEDVLIDPDLLIAGAENDFEMVNIKNNFDGNYGYVTVWCYHGEPANVYTATYLQTYGGYFGGPPQHFYFNI